MLKKDIENGMILVLENRNRFTVRDNMLLKAKEYSCHKFVDKNFKPELTLDEYNEDLTHKDNYFFNIIRIYHPSGVEGEIKFDPIWKRE